MNVLSATVAILFHLLRFRTVKHLIAGQSYRFIDTGEMVLSIYMQSILQY